MALKKDVTRAIYSSSSAFQDIEIGLSDVTYVLGPMSRVRYDIDGNNLSSTESNNTDAWTDMGEFDRGFSSVFATINEDDRVDESAPLRRSILSSSSNLTPREAAILANEKWKRKKAKHVSFYGSVSDVG